MRTLPLFLIPLLALPLLAQDEEVPAIPGVPQPPAAIDVPNPVDAAAADLGDTLIQESIEKLKLSGDDLADLYRSYTGRRVIVHSSAAAAEFRFVQPASPQDPLTYREAAELLKKAATIENFVFVPDAVDSNLDILTLATAGLKPTGRGVKVYTENDPLPEGDAVISYIMTFSYLKPDEAVRVFQQVVGQFGAFGSITASGASVIITENTSLIRKLIDLRKEIDKPSTEVATRFIDVQFADVTELATTLNELLGQQQNEATNTAGVQRQPLPADQAVTRNSIDTVLASNAAPASNSSTPVQIIPDARTNRIFAIGRPVDLIFVEGLVRQFDIKTDQRNFLRRKLEFLSVADFLPIAGDALTRAFNGTGSAGAEGGGATQAQPTGGNNRQNTQNTQNNRSQQNNNNLFNGSGSQGGNDSGGSSGSRGSSLSAPDVNTAPQSLLIGRTLLVADNITNSIVVQGPPTAVEIIENLLDQVDVKADQVMISTVFGQLSLGKSTSTGVDWLRAYDSNKNGGLAGSIIGGGPTSPNNSIDPRSIINPITGAALGSFPSRTGLSLYGRIGEELGIYANLLGTSSDFTVLSRPSIFVKNNQIGTISSGRRIAIPTNSNQFTGGGVSTNIEYRDVVLKLQVIPLVNSDKEITLQIALVSDDVIGQSDNIEGIGTVPIIGTRELLTTVTVPNNQTIVLGGLITTNDTETITGIPLLSDIPGLGRLFSTKTKGVDRDELMIFIQPSIVNSGNSLDYVQSDMDSRYDVSDPARKFSDGSVLPPLGDIQEKGSSTNRGTPPATVPVEKQSPERRTIRPMHRR